MRTQTQAATVIAVLLLSGQCASALAEGLTATREEAALTLARLIGPEQVR
ncbi:hypothetical protein [Metapseudomonas resinovorans]|uniref:Uncharacterized protein n=1 Tax=Metapseudomonas resinovorans NBRC 106553 TaxID=1245471 RepID=S6AKT1_METRE|nr:hypothetical protein [Pseudomonas resinovorans]BAN49290.1 hypothetical protein PCA10_35580 [Pseudomonas resinovorans NBRC 106553]